MRTILSLLSYHHRPLGGVLVQEGHVPHPRVRVQVGGHGPGLTSTAQSHPEVCSECAVKKPSLEAARHGGRMPEAEAGQRLLGPGQLLGEVLGDLTNESQVLGVMTNEKRELTHEEMTAWGTACWTNNSLITNCLDRG